MPRGKGGPVPGTVGKPYPNRTDLQSAEPVATGKSQQYGERAQQQASQQALPLAPPGPSQPSAGAPSTPSPPQGGGPAQPGLPPVSGPGIIPFLHETARPNEPVTAGLATGGGPGPEALTGVGAIAANQSAEQGSVKNLLGSLANGPMSSSAIRDLAAVAGA